jgi:hypothetical protein
METIGRTEIIGAANGTARVAAAVSGSGAVLGASFEAPPRAEEASEASHADRRKHARERVLKAAKIIFGGGDSVFNCLVLDESPDGIFVDLGAIVALPPEVTVQYGSGAAFRAQRRWSTGSKVGFQFIGPQIITHETARRMQVVAEIMKNHGLPAAMQTLRVAQFFDNAELRRAAEAAEAATRRLDAVLAGPLAETVSLEPGEGDASIGGSVSLI